MELFILEAVEARTDEFLRDNPLPGTTNDDE